MSDKEEFLSQIHEIREKIDIENGTPQKNKTLLQYIEELCLKELEKDPLLAEFEKEINQILEQAQKDLAKIKNISKEDNFTSSNKYVNYHLQPTKQALPSVKIGGFDPNSSPILRKLQRTKIKGHTTTIHNNLNLNEEISLDSEAKVNIEEEKEKITTEDVKPSPSDSLSLHNTEEINPTIIDTPDEEELAPFPEPTPFPVAESSDNNENRLMQAMLKVEQLNLIINLPFESNLARLGRQDFLQSTKSMNLPADFFDPIIKRSTDEEPAEHFVIEQPNPGEFILRDRFNSQKTYFLNHFIDQEGTALNDGDEFILPVNINNKLASLSVRFHLT